MALTPSNTLVQVQLYNKAGLAFLINSTCVIKNCNNKYKNFAGDRMNLGDSTLIELPPRMSVSAGLVWTTQPAVQRFQTLVCDQSFNSAFDVSSENLIFNLAKGTDEYMERFGMSQVINLASQTEARVALNFISAMPVFSAGAGLPVGLYTTSGPYRFFGNGVTPISSFQQLDYALEQYANFGAVGTALKGILPNTAYPAIVGTGLNQFVSGRNEEIANSWDVGRFGTPGAEWYKSNLLPRQIAGTVGRTQQTLTLLSTNDPTGQNVTSMTFSGATINDPVAVLSGDMFSFVRAGLSTDPYFTTFSGYVPSEVPVQFRSTANVAADGSGHVTIPVSIVYNWAGGQNLNLSNPLVANLTATGIGSHRAGCIYNEESFFLAMPRLPSYSPFVSSEHVNEEVGVSMRTAYGPLGVGSNQFKMGSDLLFGATMCQDYGMRLCFPVAS